MLLDLKFPNALYKKLLGEKMGLIDLVGIDEPKAKSYTELLKIDCGEKDLIGSSSREKKVHFLQNIYCCEKHISAIQDVYTFYSCTISMSSSAS